MNTGYRIKKLRESLDVSQTDLADEVGVSKQTLYKYENGIVTNIPSDKIESLAYALNTTPEYLMCWSDDPINYDNLDVDIPTWWDGTIKGYLEFQKALDEDREQNSVVQFGYLTADKVERDLLTSFRKLNDAGKEKAIDYVDDLGDNPKYTKSTPAPSSVLVAAHNDHADDPEEQEKIRRDLELLKKIDEQNR